MGKKRITLLESDFGVYYETRELGEDDWQVMVRKLTTWGSPTDEIDLPMWLQVLLEAELAETLTTEELRNAAI